ncbi:rCG34671, partial [Rattus norvegicus]
MTLESNQVVEFPFYISTRLVIRDSPTGLFFETVFDRIYYLVNNG